MKWPASTLCDCALVSIWFFIITSVAVWAHLMFCCGASPEYILNNNYIMYSCVFTFYYLSWVLPFLQQKLDWFSYRTLLSCLEQEKNNKKKQYVRRVDEPINASMEEFLWSPVAPVDVFHQDWHEINNPNLSAQRDRWLHMLTVCVSSQSQLPVQNYLPCMTTNKDFSSCAAAPVIKRASSCSFRLSSNDPATSG